MNDISLDLFQIADVNCSQMDVGALQTHLDTGAADKTPFVGVHSTVRHPHTAWFMIHSGVPASARAYWATLCHENSNTHKHTPTPTHAIQMRPVNAYSCYANTPTSSPCRASC